MSAKQLSLELRALQSVVSELQKKVAALEAQPRDNWLPAVLGRFKDDPDFDAAMKDAESFRNTGDLPGEPSP